MADDFTPLESVNPVAAQADDFTPVSVPAPASNPTPTKKDEGLIPQWLKASILPTVGGVAGAGAGGLISSPSILGTPAGVIGGEMAGAAAGEKLNQMLGITEPSKGAIAASAAAGPLGRGAFAVGKGLIGQGIKTLAGRDIMSEAASSLLKSWLSPVPKSGQLFDQAAQMNLAVPATNTLQKIDDVLITESQRAATPIRDSIIEAVRPLRNFFVGRGGAKAVVVPELMEEEQRLRLLSSNAYEAGNAKLGNAINSVRNAIFADLEQGGAGVVREASKAYRKEMALEDLSKLIGKPHPLQKIHDFMTDNPLFRGAFDKTEMAQIERIATKLSYIPPSGASGVFGRIATGGLGASAAGIPGAIAGAFGPDAIRALLRTPFGRGMTERILAGSPTLDAPTVAALSIFARGMMGKEPKEVQAGEY